MTKDRIAIIGAGVAGLTAAWALDRHGVEVVVYEKSEVIGGHARTIVVESGDERLRIDPGVQVFCPPIYPNLVALIRLLDVDIIPYSVGYTVADADKGVCGTSHQQTAWWREVEPEAVRFTIEMSELMVQRAAEVISCSLREYFASNGYSQAFVEFMASIAAIIGPQELEDALDTSIIVFATVLSSGFLSLLSPSSHEMAFAGGSGAFAARLAAPIRAAIRLGCGVAKIRRDEAGVEIEDERGEVERYAQVIVCVDGLLALELLDDPSPLEQNLLGGCQLKGYASIVHTDAGVLIDGIEAHDRTYLEINRGVMTINHGVLNLDRRRPRAPFLMTYEMMPMDGGAASVTPSIDPATITHRYEFRQTKDNTYAFEVKKNLFRVQGERRTWYAGAWVAMSTLEHTIVASLVIAEALGAPYPFRHDLKAIRVYDAYKAMLLHGREDFSLGDL